MDVFFRFFDLGRGCWAPCTMGATRPQAPCTDYLAYGYALSGVFVFRPVSGEPVPAA